MQMNGIRGQSVINVLSIEIVGLHITLPIESQVSLRGPRRQPHTLSKLGMKYCSCAVF